MDLATHHLFFSQGCLPKKRPSHHIYLNTLSSFHGLTRLIFHLFNLSLVGMWVDGAVVDWPSKEDMAIALLSMSKSGPRLPPLFLFHFLFLRLPFSQFRSMYVRACGILRTACWVRKNKTTKLNNLVRTNNYWVRFTHLVRSSSKYMTMNDMTYIQTLNYIVIIVNWKVKLLIC